MKTFEIGFIPSGWEKGEPLDVPDLTISPWCRAIRQKKPHIDYRNCGNPMPTDIIGELRFYKDDLEQVKKWLEWWNANPA